MHCRLPPRVSRRSGDHRATTRALVAGEVDHAGRAAEEDGLVATGGFDDEPAGHAAFSRTAAPRMHREAIQLDGPLRRQGALPPDGPAPPSQTPTPAPPVPTSSEVHCGQRVAASGMVVAQ